MTWVRRTGEQSKHQCEFPRGSLGDIWRCDICGSLWVCGEACDVCHHYGDHPNGGQHLVGVKWRPASWWQRFKHRNEGRRYPLEYTQIDVERLNAEIDP